MAAEIRDLVELVIPTYGRPSALARAVESALEETPFPVTVLDDNSPEPAAETLDVGRLAAEHGDRLRIIRNALNLGASLNILRALEVSRAQYTWPFSDDRIVPPGAAEQVTEAITEHPNASMLYWNRALPEEEHIDVEGLESYIELIERGRSIFGFSDNHYHRVLKTDVARRYVRQDARFSHAQPMLGIQIASLADGHTMHIRGGEVSGDQPGSARSWSASYLHRFKLDPAYLIPDAMLRHRYRAVAVRHFPWRTALVDLAKERRGSLDEAFAADAAMLAAQSPIPIRLRAEARLALFLGRSRLGGLFKRLLPGRRGKADGPAFDEMTW